ncbi:MAG TPA: hypothetical protein VH500_19075 [Nitrososphaeraceae archaeon]|jgi:hypothetical protein
MEITKFICDIGGPLNRNTVQSGLTKHLSGPFQTSLPSVTIEEAKMSEFSIVLIEQRCVSQRSISRGKN